MNQAQKMVRVKNLEKEEEKAAAVKKRVKMEKGNHPNHHQNTFKAMKIVRVDAQLLRLLKRKKSKMINKQTKNLRKKFCQRNNNL